MSMSNRVFIFQLKTGFYNAEITNPIYSALLKVGKTTEKATTRSAKFTYNAI